MEGKRKLLDFYTRLLLTIFYKVKILLRILINLICRGKKYYFNIQKSLPMLQSIKSPKFRYGSNAYRYSNLVRSCDFFFLFQMYSCCKNEILEMHQNSSICLFHCHYEVQRELIKNFAHNMHYRNHFAFKNSLKSRITSLLILILNACYHKYNIINYITKVLTITSALKQK